MKNKLFLYVLPIQQQAKIHSNKDQPGCGFPKTFYSNFSLIRNNWNHITHYLHCSPLLHCLHLITLLTWITLLNSHYSLIITLLAWITLLISHYSYYTDHITHYLHCSPELHCLLHITQLHYTAHLYWNFARLSFKAANWSITLLLKAGMFLTSSLFMESMASAFRLSCPITFRRNVLILYNVEKHLSASAVVMGVVMRMFNIATVSEKVSWRLYFSKTWYSAPQQPFNSGLS